MLKDVQTVGAGDSFFELEEQKAYPDHTSDVEYGITITKVGSDPSNILLPVGGL